MQRPDDVNLDNWQEGPSNRWAFLHINELMTTADIPRGSTSASQLAADPAELPAELQRFLDRTCTDGFLVLRGSTILVEQYSNDMTDASRHLLMSVSKSLCSAIFGQFVDRGDVDVSALVQSYLPELGDSAYGDATVQQVLDMTVAVHFDETYTDPLSEVQTQDRVAGWRSPRPGDPKDSYEFLATLRKFGTHGEVYQYCSANTDVLAWILERVSGAVYSELLATHLWSRLGVEFDAYVTVDAAGFAMANAAVCCTLRDLARFGRLCLDGGRNHLGDAVIPRGWLEETRRGGDNGIAGEDFWAVHPNGSYHNQFWISGDDDGSFYGIGIHGQYVWMNPSTDVVIVKLSSLPQPDDADDWARHVDFFGKVNDWVA
jgi:6-aminohexanoate-oligomer exohydrolase